MDNIKGYKIIILETCYSGGAIPKYAGPKIVAMSSSAENEMSQGYFLMEYLIYSTLSGYYDLKSAFEHVKNSQDFTYPMSWLGQHPQISDLDNLAGKIFFGDYNIFKYK